jgi:transcriptional regulator with XRE-family HTH domain
VITGPQIRAARALVGWPVRELAHRAIVSISSVNAAEGGAGPPSVSVKTFAAIQATLEAVGIEFLNDNIPGVRLHPKRRGK